MSGFWSQVSAFWESSKLQTLAFLRCKVIQNYILKAKFSSNFLKKKAFWIQTPMRCITFFSKCGRFYSFWFKSVELYEVVWKSDTFKIDSKSGSSQKNTSRKVLFPINLLPQDLGFHERAGIPTVTFLQCEMDQKTVFWKPILQQILISWKRSFFEFLCF